MRHLSEHLGAEELLLLRAGIAIEDAVEKIFGFRRGKVGGLRSWMAVIRRGAAERTEARTGFAECIEVSAPCGGVLSSLLAERGDVCSKAGEFWIDNRIGAKRGQDARLPVGIANGLMIGERVDGRIGGGEDFKIESLEEGARQKLGSAELLRDGVEVEVGSRLR